MDPQVADKVVDAGDGRIVSFPGSMGDEDIAKALRPAPAMADNSKPTQFENERQPSRQPGVTRSLLSEVGDAIKSAPNMVWGMFDPATTARRAGALFEHDQERAATRSPVYRAVADVGEAAGINAPGMEHDADIGNRRGIVGKSLGDAALFTGPSAIHAGFEAGRGRMPNYRPPEPRPFNANRAFDRTAIGGVVDLLSPNPSIGKAAAAAGTGLATEAVPWLVNKAARAKPVVDYLTKRPAAKVKEPLESEVQAWRDNTEPVKGGGPFDKKATPTEPPASKPVGEAEPMAKSPKKPVVDRGVDISRRNFLKRGGQAAIGGVASGAIKGPLSVPEGIAGVGAPSIADAASHFAAGKAAGSLIQEINMDMDSGFGDATNVDGDVFYGLLEHVQNLAKQAKTAEEISKLQSLATDIKDLAIESPDVASPTHDFLSKLSTKHPEVTPDLLKEVEDYRGFKIPSADDEIRLTQERKQRTAEQIEQARRDRAEWPKQEAQQVTEKQASGRPTDTYLGGMADPFAPTSAAQSPEFNFARPAKGPKPLPIGDVQREAFQRFVKSKGKEGPLAPPKPKGISRRPDMQDDQAVRQEIEQRTQVRPKEPGRKGKAELADEMKSAELGKFTKLYGGPTKEASNRIDTFAKRVSKGMTPKERAELESMNAEVRTAFHKSKGRPAVDKPIQFEEDDDFRKFRDSYYTGKELDRHNQLRNKMIEAIAAAHRKDFEQ